MRKAVKNKKKTNLIIIVSLVAVLLTVLLIFIIKPFYSYSSRIKNVKKVTNDGYPVMGWIRVQGTNIDYPVLYSMDSNFPLEDVDIDFAWTNSDSMSLNPRVIVSGHNIRNVSKHPLVNEKSFNNFENLPSFLYYDFVKKNKYIQYTIDGKEYMYAIYAVSMIPEDTFSYDETMTKSNKKKYIKDTIDVSYFKFNIDVDSDDQLITLVTCTRFYGDTQTLIKVDGRLLRDGEKIRNYKVTKNKNYSEVEKTMEGEEENVEEKA